MSNGSDVLLHLNSCNVWRNSGDYMPHRPAAVHKSHIVVNAMNNVWSATFAVPDWDMFQSHQPEGAFHAAARAISGGPIYLCDKPGQQDSALIRKLCLSDGSILRCASPARPARECLFKDCRKEKKLLKIVNRNGAIGVVGLFHCHDSEGPIADSFSPCDVPGLAGERFAVYFHNAAALSTLGRRGRQCLALENMAAEIATISPISGGVAALGLLDKFNGSAAIEVLAIGRDDVVCSLRDGGRVGFYCSRRPRSVRVNGAAVKSIYCRTSGLLEVRCRPGRPVTVSVSLSS